jgi:hypothetical protein
MNEKSPYFSEEDAQTLDDFYKKRPLEKFVEILQSPSMGKDAIETVLVSLRQMFVDDNKFSALVKMYSPVEKESL